MFQERTLLAQWEDELRHLRNLGLTLSQAKVYMTLINTGNLSAKQASKYANVARQDIYRILTELQKIGLVEKIITTPTKFSAVPLQESISILMERRNKATVELEAKTRELIQRVSSKEKTPVLEENENFVLIPERERLINRLKKAISTAQNSIGVIISGSVLPQVLFVFSNEIKKAMTNGVEIRYIVNKPENMDSWKEIVSDFTKNPRFKLRFLSNAPETRCGIFDKREVFIATSPLLGAFQSPVLWSSNSSLINAIQDHFETKWKAAIETEP